MPSEGPNFAGTGAEDTSGPTGATENWANMSNITASDDSRASVAIDVTNQISYFLVATNFGFSIPGGNVIDGIVVEWEKMILANVNAMNDAASRIVKGGTIGSTDKSDATWWSNVDSWYSYGSSSDLWGESWSVSDINASNFGAAIAVKYVAGFGADAGAVDACRMTVHYSTAPGSPWYSYQRRRQLCQMRTGELTICS